MVRKSILFFLFLSSMQIMISSSDPIPAARTIDYVRELILYMFRHAPQGYDQAVVLKNGREITFSFGSGLFCKNVEKAEEDFRDYPEIQLFLDHFSSHYPEKLVWEYCLNHRIIMRLERALKQKGISGHFYDRVTKENYTVRRVDQICNGMLHIWELNSKANR